ncbi:hypothetical protein [Chakrabartyella piscis]|uniref:hypothetical protein n=1 Tax=Chakrabartyella piscis TaxID=2918914 RepID=UPI002958ABE8|nr:hypothetical protein [Chakrabartyella piscis]
MNPNIKVINPHLWSVNFAYVNQRWMQEITFKSTQCTDFMTITREGIYLFNSGDQQMARYLPVIKAIMTFPNQQLLTERGFDNFVKVFAPSMEKMNHAELVRQLSKVKLYDSQKAIYETACKWEITRRQVLKKYKKERWCKPWLVFIHK